MSTCRESMEGQNQILINRIKGNLRRPSWVSVLLLFTVIALISLLQINREYSISLLIPLDFGLISGSRPGPQISSSCSDFFKQVPARKVVKSIRVFGGIGDGKTSNTEAFRRAMEFMARFPDSGGSQLVVPKGRWLTGSFNLTSNFTLFLEQGAVILGSQDPKEWPLINALPSYGRGRERLGARHISLIHGNGLTNVVITGENGTVDGQGKMWWELWWNRTLVHTRGHLVELINSQNILIHNLTFLNSPFWTIHPVYCRNIVIRNMTILAPWNAPNTDGIDPDSSVNVCIEDCYIESGDDLVAVKSGWDQYGMKMARPSSNIIVRRVTGTTPTCSGVGIGSEMSGGVSNVIIEDLYVTDSAAGVRIKTDRGRADTGEVIKEFKVSKKPFSSVAHSTDEKIIAAASDKLRFLSLESGKELLKLSPASAVAQRLWLSDDAQFAVTAGLGERQLQVWKLDFGERAADYGQVLSMKHPPIIVECRKNCKGEDGMVVLAISEKGVCYVWNFESVTDEVVKPIKITVKASKGETEKKTGRAKKNIAPIIAARLHVLDRDAHLRALIAYGSVESPEFTSVDISSPGEDIVIAAVDQAEKVLAAVQENGHARKGADMENEGVKLIQKSKVTNKRPASDLDVTPPVTITDDGNGEPIDGVQIDDLNEPTMGEKLARLHLADNNEDKSNEDLESPPQTKPPSADSVHVLLKQALHADDRALLIDCLYRQDEKVIANSVSLLNPSDVLKLLQSLLSIIQSRGAVLACALPWLQSLLLQHASGIMSQESSLLVLNSLYQLIDARLSTLHQALQLSSSLELLYAGTIDDGDEEDGAIQPIIYEDESDEEGSEVAMETESNPDVEEPEAFSDISDHGLSDGMSE